MDEMLLGPSVAAGSSAGCRSVVEYFIVARCWRNGFFTCLFIEVHEAFAKRRTAPSPFPLGNGWSFGWAVPRRDSKLCSCCEWEVFASGHSFSVVARDCVALWLQIITSCDGTLCRVGILCPKMSNQLTLRLGWKIDFTSQPVCVTRGRRSFSEK